MCIYCTFFCKIIWPFISWQIPNSFIGVFYIILFYHSLVCGRNINFLILFSCRIKDKYIVLQITDIDCRWLKSKDILIFKSVIYTQWIAWTSFFVGTLLSGLKIILNFFCGTIDLKLVWLMIIWLISDEKETFSHSFLHRKIHPSFLCDHSAPTSSHPERYNPMKLALNIVLISVRDMCFFAKCRRESIKSKE